MSDYAPTTWATSDVITAVKLNNAETGIDTAHTEIATLEEVDAGARIYGYKNLGGAL